MAEQVRIRVRQMASTVQHRQTPAYYNQVLGRICLAGSDCIAAAVPIPPTTAPQQLSEAAEAWDRTKDATAISVLETFISRYKDTFYAELARARVEQLKQQFGGPTSEKPFDLYFKDFFEKQSRAPVAVSVDQPPPPQHTRRSLSTVPLPPAGWGWLGIKVQSVNTPMAEKFGVVEKSGALIAAVQPNSPAADAGLQSGDIIATFDGKEVGEIRELPNIIRGSIPKHVDAVVVRNGETRTLKITVGQLSAGEGLLVGIVLANITGELRAKYKIRKNVKGVLVLEVDPTSPGGSVRVGSLITRVANEPVDSIEDVVKGRTRQIVFMNYVEAKPPKGGCHRTSICSSFLKLCARVEVVVFIDANDECDALLSMRNR